MGLKNYYLNREIKAVRNVVKVMINVEWVR